MKKDNYFFRKNKKNDYDIKLGNDENEALIVMKKKTNNLKETFSKYSTVVFSMILVVVFVFVLGGSYAFFTYTVKAKQFVIYTGTLAVDYTKKTDVINISDLYPMTNSQGLNQTAHEFNVTNNGNINARYQVRLEMDNSIKDLISPEYIKLAYSVDGSSYSEPVLLSNLGGSLVFLIDMKLEPTQSNTIGIKLWIDINAPNDIQGKTFKARVVVDSIQDVDDGYVVDTAPIIYLNKDKNGNQDMIINTNSTYVDLGVNRIVDDQDTLTVSQVTKKYEYYDGTETTTVSNIDTSKEGIYYITYSITDQDNNVGNAVRVVAVGNNDDLKIYHGIDSVVSSFSLSSLKEAIMCSYIDGNDRLYFDCKIHNTIENAIASKTKGVVIMTNDIERNNNISINESKEIALELNGHVINFSETYCILNYGTLDVNQYSKTGTINSYSRVILTYGITNIHNGQFINNHPTNDGTATLFVLNDGILNVYGTEATFDSNGDFLSGTYVKGNENSSIILRSGTTNVYGGTIEKVGTLGATIRSNFNEPAVLNMYGGKIIGASHGIGFEPDSLSTSTINIYDGEIIANTHGVYNNSLATVNIYGGNIKSVSGNALANISTGVINILQSNNPLYISSLAQEWKPVIINGSSGIINITANKANNCTNNFSDTTSGLCVYGEGDGTTNNTGNSAVQNYTGVININGGTYYGGNQGVNNNSDGGITNIQNAYVISGKFGILNNSTGTVNICNTIVNSAQYDLANSSTGYINYSSNVTFTNGTNNPTVSGTTGNILPNYTGTCIVE